MPPPARCPGPLGNRHPSITPFEPYAAADRPLVIAAGYWIDVLEAAGVPCSLIQNVAEAVAHPQTQARNMVVHAGALLMAGNPIKSAAFPDAPTRRPALNADGESIHCELARGWIRIDEGVDGANDRDRHTRRQKGRDRGGDRQHGRHDH